jgi:membrane protein implicated in regulation of membrane protease activity
MSAGRIIATLVAGLILGIVAGIITKNIFVAVVFPILLVVFLLMWRNLRQKPSEKITKKEVESEQLGTLKEESQQEETEDSQIPVSTTYPPQRPPTY